jgi:uncharacterized protein (TIGR00251 family)
MDTLEIQCRGSGSAFCVRVVPRTSRNEIAGTYKGAVRLRLTGPPVEGAANKALIRLLSDLLGVPKQDVEIVTGHSGRQKLIAVFSLSPQDVHERLVKDGLLA